MFTMVSIAIADCRVLSGEVHRVILVNTHMHPMRTEGYGDRSDPACGKACSSYRNPEPSCFAAKSSMQSVKVVKRVESRWREAFIVCEWRKIIGSISSCLLIRDDGELDGNNHNIYEPPPWGIDLVIP